MKSGDWGPGRVDREMEAQRLCVRIQGFHGSSRVIEDLTDLTDLTDLNNRGKNQRMRKHLRKVNVDGIGDCSWKRPHEIHKVIDDDKLGGGQAVMNCLCSILKSLDRILDVHRDRKDA